MFPFRAGHASSVFLEVGTLFPVFWRMLQSKWPPCALKAKWLFCSHNGMYWWPTMCQTQWWMEGSGGGFPELGAEVKKIVIMWEIYECMKEVPGNTQENPNYFHLLRDAALWGQCCCFLNFAELQNANITILLKGNAVHLTIQCCLIFCRFSSINLWICYQRHYRKTMALEIQKRE